MLFVEYPKCTTCKKAKKFLDDHHIDYTDRDIKSGLIYREQQLKDKLPGLSEEEKLALLASNGMLVKRPILVLEDKVLVGFKEKEWMEALNL